MQAKDGNDHKDDDARLYLVFLVPYGSFRAFPYIDGRQWNFRKHFNVQLR